MTRIMPHPTALPRRRTYKPVLAAVLLGLLGASALSVQAENLAPLNAQAAMPPATASDWQGILAQAERRLDMNLVTEADLARVRAERSRANGWLAGAPVIDGLYRDDRPMTNRGEGEMQLDMRLPLRRFDQTGAWQRLSEQAALNAKSREAATRLELLGTLRQLAWDWRRAETTLKTAEQQATIMRRNLDVVTHQVKLGEAAEVDRLTVESSLLSAEDAVHQARIQFQNAQSRWQSISGSPALPTDLGAPEKTPIPTTPVTAESLFQTHPILRRMASEVGLDSAKIDAERAAGAGAPELGFGIKRDRGDRGTPWDNSLLVTLSLPIGGQAYRNPALAEMAQQKAQAQVALMRTAHQIQGDVTAYQQRVAEWPTRIAQLDRRAELTEKTLKLKEKALRLGELDWSRLMYFEQEAASARLQANLAHIDYRADQSGLKQSLGLMPGTSQITEQPGDKNTPQKSTSSETKGMTP